MLIKAGIEKVNHSNSSILVSNSIFQSLNKTNHNRDHGLEM